MGSPEFGLPTLAHLHQRNDTQLIGIITQPDKKKGRGKILSPTPIKQWALNHGIPISCPTQKSELAPQLKQWKPTLIIVIAYGLIIPRSILEIPRIGCFNLHGSLLPRWRGAAPIQRAIIEGDNNTGITFMKMNEGLDTGDIVLSKEINIKINDNQQSLENKLANLGAESFEEFLELIQEKSEFIKQNNDFATYAKKIEKFETKLDWNEPAEKIIRRINAYSPNPGAWFEFKGKRIKILEASLSSQLGKSGTIISDDLIIGCGEQSIQPRKLKKEGKEEVNLNDFLRGNKIEKGYVIQ